MVGACGVSPRERGALPRELRRFAAWNTPFRCRNAPPIRVLASSISFAAAQAPPLTHFAARPFPTRTALLGSRGNPAYLVKKNAPCTVEEKISAGLMGREVPSPRKKRELDSPVVQATLVDSAARRASGGRCGRLQPTGRLRLKGFQHPLAAAAGRLKERQSPKLRPMLGAPLQVRCSRQGPPIELQFPAPTDRAAASGAKP